MKEYIFSFLQRRCGYRYRNVQSDFFHHTVGKDAYFDLFAFSIIDTKNNG